MCQKEIKTSMGKMKNKVLPVSVLVLFMLMCINACGISKSRDSADMVSELNNRIIEKVAENYEEGNISALDIVIVRIDFGSFSQDNASEIFVLCKILNTPHVAGLDKTVGILLDADSLEMVAYKEFAADKVVINCIQASDLTLTYLTVLPTCSKVALSGSLPPLYFKSVVTLSMSSFTSLNSP